MHHFSSGTPEYLAPEVLLGQGYGKAVDYWSYGSVVYEMLTGNLPYYSPDITEMYKKILQAPLDIPKDFDKPTRDFLAALLDRNPEKRLQDPKLIRRHAYFKSINWDDMINMRVPAPFIPPEEYIYDDEDEFVGGQGGEEEEGGGDDAFADFDGTVLDEDGNPQQEIPDDGLPRCRALHNWDGENPDDLPLTQGQLIIILDNESDPGGWWQGEIDDGSGATGFFPSNFVELV